MGTTVIFSPSTINCGITQPGSTAIGTSQCAPVTAPVNVTASISADTSGGALTLVSVASWALLPEIEVPDPGELPPGVRPKPVKSQVPVQRGQSNGVTPLPVSKGEYVEVMVQFAPTASTPDVCTATLQINGDTWNPVSLSLTGSVGEVTVNVPPITVVQNQSTTAEVAVTLAYGSPTTADLTLLPGNGTPTQIANFALPPASYDLSPEGILTLTPPASNAISSGSPAIWTLTVSARSLNPGTYVFQLVGSAFGGAYTFGGATVTITVELPYFQIQSQLGGVIDIDGASGLDAFTPKSTDNDNQLWAFVPDPAGSGYYYIVSKLNGNVIDIEGASRAAGALLDAFPRNVAADGLSGSENQLWYFVLDPSGTGDCFIVSALNGNVIDIQGGSASAGTPLDAFPVKLTGFNNQLWTVVGGAFPSVVQTVPAPAGLGNGNVNWNLGGQTVAITGLSVTVEFTSDFVSAANGYSFQLNCYSTEPSSTEWQQFVIWCRPNDTFLPSLSLLWARIDTWSGTASTDELNRIDAPLCFLPTPTIPKRYGFTITLNYHSTGIVGGATYTATDGTGQSVGSATISILGQTLRTTNQPATTANLAPIAAFEFCIGGYGGSTTATLTSAAGKITYNATPALAVSTTEPTYTAFNDPGTGENANLLFGPMPWPWSLNMTNLNTQVMQVFELPTGSPTELLLKARPGAHSLPPPDALSLGAHATLYHGTLAAAPKS